MTGRLRFFPPKKSLASDWIVPAAASLNVFNITVSAGGIVILDVEATLTNAQATVSITSITTATLGQAYYLALDGRATNIIRPVGMVTTA